MITKEYFQSYLRNIVTLMVGTGLSQLLPILASPILTRIYSPVNFGEMAVFISICSVIGMFSTGLYEMSILKSNDSHLNFNILILVSLLSISSSLIVFIILSILYCFTNFVPTKFLILPLGIFFTGLFQGLTYWLLGSKSLVELNKLKITQSLLIVITGILFGFINIKSMGLIFSFLFGGIPVLILTYNIYISNHKFLNWTTLKSLAHSNIYYPKVIMPTSIMNTLGSQIPIYFISHYFTQFITGNYSLANRILIAPVSIIGVSFGQIYLKNISSLVSKNEPILPTFIDSLKILLPISIFIFLPLNFFGEDVFSIIFGKEWLKAGYMVTLLAFPVLLKFIVSPISSILIATKSLTLLAAWQIMYFVGTLLLFIIFRKSEFYSLLKIYIYSELFFYSLYLIFILYSVKIYDKNLRNLEY